MASPCARHPGGLAVAVGLARASCLAPTSFVPMPLLAIRLSFATKAHDLLHHQ
jgi:hypothetical protein